MSRIGRKAMAVPKLVIVTESDGLIEVKGPMGGLRRTLARGIGVRIEGGKILVSRSDDGRQSRANHGLMRAHLANMLKGVTEGWTRELEINGIGYRAEIAGNSITMALGYSHPVVFRLPVGVTAKIDKNRLILTSVDRELIGQTAAKIRELRPPEPYKGKGVKYVEESIKRKVGKAGATTSGGAA